jgi:periplasmic protein CpxP/Spy
MWKRRFFKFVLPVAAIAASAALFSGCHRSCHRMSSPEGRADWVVKKISNELDLDANQKTKLNAIKTDILLHRPNFMGWRDSLSGDFLSQLRSDTIDKDKVNSILEDKEAKMKEFRAFMVDKFVEFHAILTPTQREKLATKLNDMKSHHKCD